MCPKTGATDADWRHRLSLLARSLVADRFELSREEDNHVKRLALFVLATFAWLAGGLHAPSARASTQQPAKVAVIILENKDWTQITTTAYPYLTGTIRPDGIDLQPGPNASCDYPKPDGAGTGGTIACMSGMFNSYRDPSGFRANGSAPEYAFLSMGTDADIRDTQFPSDGTGRGYSPLGNASNPTYNVFDFMESQSIPFTVYNEDYRGGATSCSTAQWSDASATDHNFYARKHNPLLLIWNQTPDATVTSGQTPASAPSDALCKAHMRNFPGNTPNATVDAITNFDGDEGADFGPVTFITPSMCHDGHNGDVACGTNNGGAHGIEAWLSANYDGIRKDVGQDGVVVITFDESAGSDCDGTGLCKPFPTYIVPGTDAAGNPATLAACASPPCEDTSTIYSTSSTNRAILEALGTSCSILNDTNIDQGQTLSAQDLCRSATPLPIQVDVTAAGRPLFPQPGNMRYEPRGRVTESDTNHLPANDAAVRG